MCRLYGFRSVIDSQVHHSLLDADNALAQQSARHPDGWGVAYYLDEAPHVTRSSSTALNDQLFSRLSGVVSSQTVLAHVRRATVGEPNVLNCHPFQYGKWVFAHNGDIPEFERCREKLEAEIPPRLRRFILGDTDSERVFYLFLGRLARHGPLTTAFRIDTVASALQEAVEITRSIADGPDAPEPAKLTLMATNGVSLAAIEGGKELYFSTHKTRCPDRDVCPHFAEVCEHPSPTGFINHFIVSSEPLSDHNVWLPVEAGETIGVDWRMQLSRFPGSTERAA